MFKESIFQLPFTKSKVKNHRNYKKESLKTESIGSHTCQLYSLSPLKRDHSTASKIVNQWKPNQ